MDNKSLVKRELLRRKIKEHWNKNPNAESLIVKANFGGVKTFWHVVKEGKSHKVTEVDTKKEVFLIGEVGWPYVGEQDDPVNDKKKKKEKGKDKDKEPKADKPDKPEKSASPKPEKDPVIPDAKPAGEMGDEEPDDASVGIDKLPGDETAPPGEMGLEDDGLSADPQEKPKTGQELELQRIVHKKPLMGVDVVTDEEGGHVTLKFPGDANDVVIDVFKDGKVVYTHKDRARMLKTGMGGVRGPEEA